MDYDNEIKMRRLELMSQFTPALLHARTVTLFAKLNHMELPLPWLWRKQRLLCLEWYKTDPGGTAKAICILQRSLVGPCIESLDSIDHSHITGETVVHFLATANMDSNGHL